MPRENLWYNIFSKDVLEKVRSDIVSTIFPSWLEKPPSDFGSPAHGKLKADHWCTVATVNLVITLHIFAGYSLYDHKLVPNHHLSLHLRPLLEVFGPVHGWTLQHMSTNSRAEDMPGTFMRCWYIGTNLRWLMQSMEWPKDPIFANMVRMYDTAFRDRVRGTCVTDILHALDNRTASSPCVTWRDLGLLSPPLP
ncbi:uncharacterized protein TRAVEDRAFT_20801 [Trametes versicolor FP-101664 SS1]|uniref:uncharacterized protein n=1 Tax=Trametes versicolor (strain FP-101664) TaxID=717944 RepID=UPI000462217B|nr:uncharacterized protein TRAVEDRAFT_20801 [Trametes versicolor FP-101664 SS1]EIW58990.1 hypothetical protein TRAVEDRAFT_20801 [Trametes versicolor FP-101664 SS1]